jgi:hypothetical protein
MAWKRRGEKRIENYYPDEIRKAYSRGKRTFEMGREYSSAASRHSEVRGSESCEASHAKNLKKKDVVRLKQ